MAKKKKSQNAPQKFSTVGLAKPLKNKQEPAGCSNLRRALPLKAKEIINYITPEWAHKARLAIANRKKNSNQRNRSIFGRLSRFNQPSAAADEDDDSYNVFCDFIPQIIEHKVITIHGDSSEGDSDGDSSEAASEGDSSEGTSDGCVTILEQGPSEADGDDTIVEQGPSKAAGETPVVPFNADDDIETVEQVPSQTDGGITVEEQVPSDADDDIIVVKQVRREDQPGTSRTKIVTVFEKRAEDSDSSVLCLSARGSDSDSDSSRDSYTSATYRYWSDIAARQRSRLRNSQLDTELRSDSSDHQVDSEVIFVGESKSGDGNTLRRTENNTPAASDSPNLLEDLTLVDEAISPPVLETSNSTMRLGSPKAGASNNVLHKVYTGWSMHSQRANGGISPGFGRLPSEGQSTQSTSGRGRQPLLPVPRPFGSDASMVFSDLLSEGTADMCQRILRRWDCVKTTPPPGVPVRICSYNVLCQDTIAKTKFLYTHLFRSNRSRLLSWSVRSLLLIREFSLIDADVFCLQEVQADQYHSFYKPLFHRLGYDGRFKKRTHYMKDGCAIFVRSPFTLIHYQPIEYFIGENTILDRDNVGQIARIKHNVTGWQLCIANTHLLFNQKRGDVKLAQLALLIASLHKECSKRSKWCPYVMCGDFNMAPNCAIAKFVLESRMSMKGLKTAQLSGMETAQHNGGQEVKSNLMPVESDIGTRCRYESDPNEITAARDVWTHPLNFASVYNHVTADQCPEVSAFTYNAASNPDFIFYSLMRDDDKGPDEPVTKRETTLVLARRLALPSELVLRATLGPWPNEATPSDHIPLIADFILT